jgi:hypothetical protein
MLSRIDRESDMPFLLAIMVDLVMTSEMAIAVFGRPVILVTLYINLMFKKWSIV